MNNFFCNHKTQKSDPEHTFSEIDINYRRDYSKGKSFKVSIWNEIDTYNNDDFIQDFVIYNQSLWARIDSTPSTNEPPTEGPWIKVMEGVSDVQFKEEGNKIFWKYEDESEWKDLFELDVVSESEIKNMLKDIATDVDSNFYDKTLSETSVNAVQNKVITQALNKKADKTELSKKQDVISDLNEIRNKAKSALQTVPAEYATKTDVSNEVAKIVNSAPKAFDTLKEIADWIEKDAEPAIVLANKVEQKADKSELVIKKSVGTSSAIQEVEAETFTDKNEYSSTYGQEVKAEASGDFSLALGGDAAATAKRAVVQGHRCIARGETSHAEGHCAVVEYIDETFNGYGAHAEGYSTFVAGSYSHVEGSKCVVVGSNSHAEGGETGVMADMAHAEGYKTSVEIGADGAHAEGNSTEAHAKYSHTEGRQTHTSGEASHAEGTETHAWGDYSHSEGNGAQSRGLYSHAEGIDTYADAAGAHAEGFETHANNECSHAEGHGAVASGIYAHAEGWVANAIGEASHAEGQNTRAHQIGSHSEGNNTDAKGPYSHAEGIGTKTKEGIAGQHVEGYYNKETDSLKVIGCGTSDNDRKNAVEVTQDGRVFVKGVGNYDGTSLEAKDLATVINEGGQGGSSVTPDWNASEGEEGFIKNRTHYKKQRVEVIDVNDIYYIEPEEDENGDIIDTEYAYFYVHYFDASLQIAPQEIYFSINGQKSEPISVIEGGIFGEVEMRIDRKQYATLYVEGVVEDLKGIILSLRVYCEYELPSLQVCLDNTTIKMIDEVFIPYTIARSEDLDVALDIALEETEALWENVDSLEQELTELSERVDALGEGGGGASSDKQGVVSQTLTYNSADNTYSVSNVVRGSIPSFFIDLVTEAGASFNAESGYFSLNGIDNIAYDEMRQIYDCRTGYGTNSLLAVYGFTYTARTNFAAFRGTSFSASNHEPTTIYTKYLGYQNASITKFALSDFAIEVKSGSANNFDSFGSGGAPLQKSRLEEIIGIICVSNLTGSNNFFYNGAWHPWLTSFQLKSLKASIDLSGMPRLSEATILYMINNEKAASAITIKLHADAKAMADASEAIQSALANHANITLGV